MAGSLLRGGAACVPLVPREGLSESFIDPAIAWLTARSAVLRTGARVAGFGVAHDRITSIRFAADEIQVAADDAVVLAVPPSVAADLVPSLVTPLAFESIVNVHFRLDADPGRTGFVGLVGGTAEWIFVKSGIVSITISAANRLADVANDTIAARAWSDVKQALRLEGDQPPVRVVREKRATFAATADNEALRPGPTNRLAGFAVAGDWTATGLPATIEGAIRSGRIAAAAVLAA